MKNTLEESEINHLEKVKLKTGILLVNLGTPEKCEEKEIRKFLREFLSDPRVIDIPAPMRFLLLNLLILPFRPREIKKQYREIWMEQGSPLIVHSRNLFEKLQKTVDEKITVKLCMRYGSPDIEQALSEFRNPEFKKIIVLPLYPQYSSSVTGSVNEKVMNIVSKWQTIPSIEFVNYFYNHPKFIQAFAKIGKNYEPDNYDHILFSFHSIPERHIINSDETGTCMKSANCCEITNRKNHYCYKAQCIETAHLIAESLNISRDNYSISFQSRLGRTPWIQPYTDKIIKDIAERGIKKLLVFSPSFVTDCLETSYEIAVTYNQLFISYGGEKLQLVESLNSSDIWVECIKNILDDLINS